VYYGRLRQRSQIVKLILASIVLSHIEREGHSRSMRRKPAPTDPINAIVESTIFDLSDLMRLWA
jgi:hypothetical protein